VPEKINDRVAAKFWIDLQAAEVKAIGHRLWLNSISPRFRTSVREEAGSRRNRAAMDRAGLAEWSAGVSG